MPGSRASVFGEAEDFQAALSADRVAGLLVTGRGQFRARLTQVRLDGWRLAAVEEALSRIAFVAVPAGMVLVSFSIDGGPSPVWGGIEVRTGRPRPAGACKNARIRSLGRHSGAGPAACPIRPRAEWSSVCRSACGALAAAACSGQTIAQPPPSCDPDGGGARGSTDGSSGRSRTGAAIAPGTDRVSGGWAEEEKATGRRHRDILTRFEALLVAEPSAGIADICGALGVSQRSLR